MDMEKGKRITTKLCDGLAEIYESKTTIQIETRRE
jgi:hypothetical protein